MSPCSFWRFISLNELTYVSSCSALRAQSDGTVPLRSSNRCLSSNRLGWSPAELIKGQGTKLIDLAAYQGGSVVSKEIINKKTGTVTLFAFDEGQGLSEHTVPFDALVYVLDGAVEIFVSGKPHHLKEGDMIIMPANHPHALKAEKKFKMLLIMIRSECLKKRPSRPHEIEK